MNNKVIATVSFVAGAAVGGAATWYFVKRKFDEELESLDSELSQGYIDRLTEYEDTIDKLQDAYRELAYSLDEVEEISEEDAEEYINTIEDNGYSNNSKEENMNLYKAPYIIDHDKFGEMYDYDAVSLRYYSDGIMADEDLEIIDNWEEIIGVDMINKFGDEYGDVIYVRNDENQTDYEIIKDEDRYEDILNNQDTYDQYSDVYY